MPKGVYERTPESRAKTAAGARRMWERRNMGITKTMQKAWESYNMMPIEHDAIKLSHGIVHVPHAACYLKEARAMLAGTKKRYNPCAKLEGD